MIGTIWFKNKMEVKKKETKKQFNINDGFNGLEMRRKIKSKNESMGKIKWDYNLIIKCIIWEYRQMMRNEKIIMDPKMRSDVRMNDMVIYKLY